MTATSPENSLSSRPPAGRRVLFSGAQPSGQGSGLTLGNLIGAVKNWVRLQADYDCLFSIVDLHAITLRQDPQALRENTYSLLATYVAAGVDPERNVVFAQSHVPQHAELAWALTCFTYMGELARMTQFKDKSAKGQNVGAGLYVYPTLMAADILLYQTHLVPVGHDQKQHLELARDLANRFNNQVREGLFQEPEAYIAPVGARIMSLQDPSSKMSKSDENAAATIFLSDSDDAIAKKFKRAVTDSVGAVNYSDEQPGVKNLLSIEAAITGVEPQTLAEEMAGKQYGYLKARVADVVIAFLKPIREEQERLAKDRIRLDEIFRQGAERASERAEATVRKTYEALGFVRKTALTP